MFEHQFRAKARARRILVVDDHKDSAESLAMFLRFMGNDVHASYDGPSALEAAAVYMPEVVLLDIGLPGMTGYDVARSLRKPSGLDNAVLIAVTGWGQEEDLRFVKRLGLITTSSSPSISIFSGKCWRELSRSRLELDPHHSIPRTHQ